MPALRPLFRPLGSIAVATALAASICGCADPSPDSPQGDPGVQLLALHSIDGEELPGQSGFGRIADLELGADGSVFVLDGLNRAIHLFDDGGDHVTTFGARGEGPGEFERPTDLAWGPDGRLWVVDPGNGRVTVFEVDGGLVATHPVGDPPPWAFGFSGDGLLYTVTSGFDLLSMSFQFVENEVGTEGIRELRRFDLPFVEQPRAFEQRGDDMMLVLQVPFSPEPLFRIGPDAHLWHAHTGEPWVYRRSIPGPGEEALGPEETYGRAFDAPPVTPADREAVRSSDDVERVRSELGAEAVARFMDLLPDSKPHLEGFFLDDERNVWIIRTRGDGRGDGTFPVDIHDVSGSLLGTVRTAFEAEPRPRARGGIVAGVRRDDLGVESVELYRIRR